MNKKKLSADYAAFHDYLEAARRDGRRVPDFEEVCRSLGISSRKLEDLIYSELGVSGASIVSVYRN